MTQPPTVHRDELDGVPVFWVDSGRPTMTARLQFRTGSAEETLPTSGFTHLAQHLALQALPTRDDREVGGSAGPRRTTFHVEGAEAGVRRFLIDVCEWLGTPDLGTAVKQGHALRAEHGDAGPDPAAQALLRRYGAGGPGLVGFAEPGLHHPQPDAVRALIRAWFTRGNAALVLDRPLPVAFGLPLRDGPRRPLPRLPAPRAPRPAAYLTDHTLSLSGEVPRTAAASLLPELLRRALAHDLRGLLDPHHVEAGAWSAPWATAEPVGAEAAVVVAGFRVPPALLEQVVEYAHGAVDALRRNGPRADELAEVVAAAVWRLGTPAGALGLAEEAAADHLDGRPALQPRSFVDRLTAVTADDVQGVADGFGSTLLLGVPAAATWAGGVPLLTGPTGPERPRGRSHRSRNAPGDRTRLVVGRQAISVGRRGQWRGLAYDEVAAMLATPDGRRELVSIDGWAVVVEPTLWADGEQAVADLDGVVPTELVVPVAERSPHRVPRAAGRAERWSGVPYLWTALVVLLALGAVLLAATTGQRTVAVFATIGGLVAITLTATRHRGTGGT